MDEPSPQAPDKGIFTLQNANGCEVRITNYGGIILSLKVPDRTGNLDDVVLGFGKVEDYLTAAYLERGPYFGALIGRYANRIARGTFQLAGRTFQVPTNDGANALHGGIVGFDKKTWTVHDQPHPGGSALHLSHVSPAGEQGFPGTLTADIVYRLSAENELRLEMTATSDEDTVVNLTQHTYFNLRGVGRGNVLSHELLLKAGRIVPIDQESIPLGDLTSVQDTPFDFRRLTPIGARIDEPDVQLKHGQGYDHCYVLDDYSPGCPDPRMFARVVEPASGRVLEVSTTQPGVQFYSGNQLDGTFHGKGTTYRKHDGFCLEPQHFPDSPNRPAFPSVILRAGERYQHTIAYRFSVAS